jgi:hypothetical protein
MVPVQAEGEVMAQRVTGEALRQIRAFACGDGSPTRPVHISAGQVNMLFAEIDARGTDVSWLLSELGHEHWRNCDDDDCYLCDGYAAIRDRYGVNP